MPRVRPLGAAQQAAAKAAKLTAQADQTVMDLLVLMKAHTHQTDQDIADALHWDRSRIQRMKRSPGLIRLQDVRDFIQMAGASKEDWLRIGGFEV